MSRLWRGLKAVVQTRTVSPTISHHYHTIQAIPRESTGSRVSSRDRTQGRIPAVVFSQGLLEKNPANRSPSRKQLLTTERKQIQTILKSVKPHVPGLRSYLNPAEFYPSRFIGMRRVGRY
ncbi:hypothetical protein DITRI_Ditri14bG0113400 [Diplodiscus trichospermus]